MLPPIVHRPTVHCSQVQVNSFKNWGAFPEDHIGIDMEVQMGFQASLSEAKHIKKRQCRHSKAKEFETIHTEGWIYI